MALSNQDQEAVRQYLLGHLTHEEQAGIEERLLTEDDFFDEFEVVKDELVEEYLVGQLSRSDRQWFEQNFLASAEGKQRQRFARNLNRYISNHLPTPQKKLSWGDRFAAFWNHQPGLLRAATAVAAIVIVVGVFWFSRSSKPQAFASLNLSISSSTRSSGSESPKVSVKSHDLRLTLMLPAATTPGDRYRVDLTNDKGETKASEAVAESPQSVSVNIPAAQLPPGEYAVTLSTINTNGVAQRIPGSYYFTVE